MYLGRTTLSKFLIEELRGLPQASDLGALLVDVAAAVKAIAAMSGKGALGGYLCALDALEGRAGTPPPLEVLARDALIQSCEWGGLVAGMASPALPGPYPLPEAYRRGPFLLVFDALDGQAARADNVTVGTTFAVLPHEGGAEASESSYLQPGRAQRAAGYALYGPATMLVLTVGRGTHGFTLDREVGNFILTHPNLQIPAEGHGLAVDTSLERFWEPPVRRYVAECKAGRAGDRGADFAIRWGASGVAEVHRLLLHGGVFMVPRTRPDPEAPADEGLPEACAALHQLALVQPMAWLVEQAGGCASTGRGSALDVVPAGLHQRLPMILGSSLEVERLARYHAEHDCGADRAYDSPLFNRRSLYRDALGFAR